MNEEIESLKQTIANNPNDAKAYCSLARAYFNLKRYDEAVECYKQAIRIKPDYSDAYYNLGLNYFNLRQYTDAIEAYKNVIRINPDDIEAYKNLGVAYSNLKRYSCEIEAYKNVIRTKPDDTDAHYNLGKAYSNLRQYTDAIEAYKNVIRINPDDADAHYNLGVAYLITYKIYSSIYDKHLSIVEKYILSAVDEYSILKDIDEELAAKLSNLIKSCGFQQSPSSQQPIIVPEMVYIPTGEFMMGSNTGLDNAKPVHLVKVDAFYIGKYQVTQRDWTAVMGINPSEFKGDDLPVECVSWNDAQEYLQKLSSITGKRWRLPTEAEWEYACRAGSITNYCFGDKPKQYFFGDKTKQLGEYSWYKNNSGKKTHPVGLKRPNAWGLYDMHGNVWEWCQDWYDEIYYSNSHLTNPTGPSTGNSRVLRGGSWGGYAAYVRSAFRGRVLPDGRSYNIGFRCVHEP